MAGGQSGRSSDVVCSPAPYSFSEWGGSFSAPRAVFYDQPLVLLPPLPWYGLGSGSESGGREGRPGFPLLSLSVRVSSSGSLHTILRAGPGRLEERTWINRQSQWKPWILAWLPDVPADICPSETIHTRNTHSAPLLNVGTQWEGKLVPQSYLEL